MKRALVFLLFLILLACQPTPEVDAVKQKDTNVLIETVRNEEETGAAAIPARFRLDETVSRGNVRIHADVPIEVLSETGTFPVLRVERRYLSDDERLTIARRLLSSDALYVWEYRETRASVAVQIAEYMRELSPEEKAAWMRETDSTEEDYEEMLARRKALAEQYQKRYNELPEDEALSPLAPWNGSVPAYSEDIANHRNEITIVRSDANTGVLWSLDYVEASANGGNSPLTFAAAQNYGADSTNVWFFNQTDKPGVERIARSAHFAGRGDRNGAVRVRGHQCVRGFGRILGEQCGHRGRGGRRRFGEERALCVPDSSVHGVRRRRHAVLRRDRV